MWDDDIALSLAIMRNGEQRNSKRQFWSYAERLSEVVAYKVDTNVDRFGILCESENLRYKAQLDMHAEAEMTRYATAAFFHNFELLR